MVHCNRRRLAVLLAAGLAVAAAPACDDAVPAAPVGRLAVSVAPLTLAGVTNATYTLTVRNADSAVVWTRTLDADAYGDGAGSLAYVGTCDAGANPNTVELVVESLEAGGVTLVSGVDWINPAPPGDPVDRSAICLANADVAVGFDIALARAAHQGFFDVALSFSDVFCSAKLDCQRDLGGGAFEDLLLLNNPLSGARDLTAVLGFACTAGPGQATVLHMDPVELRCQTGQSAVVDPSLGPGNLDPAFPGPAPNTTALLFQAAVYRGQELLGTNNKAYWNVALGLNRDAFGPTGARDCTLTAAATVSDGDLIGGATPAGTRWPYVSWQVPVVDADGARICGRHEAGGGDGVELAYTDTAGIAFAASFDWTDGGAVTAHQTPCTIPHCTTTGLCSAATGDPVSCAGACEAGWYGPTCAGACAVGSCAGTMSCDANGDPLACTGGCDAGWYGLVCASACPVGACLGAVTCDAETGAALSCDACPLGTFGAACTLTPRVWYRADALALANGAAVTSWPDGGAAAKPLSPKATAPTFRTNVVNGKPVVRFVKGGGMQSAAFVLQAGSHDFTMFLVMRAGTSQNTYANIFDNNHGGGGNPSLQAAAAGPVVQQNVAVQNQMSTGWWTGAAYTGGPTYQVSAAGFQIHEDRKGGTTLVHRINGAVQGTGGVGATMQQPSVPLAIGSNTYVAGREWDGDLAEVLYFNAALADVDRVAVERYLGTKFAITVP